MMENFSLKLHINSIKINEPAKATPSHFISFFIYPPNFKREATFPLFFNIEFYNTRLNKAVE